jgi:PBSX family phage terminase large subunit
MATVVKKGTELEVKLYTPHPQQRAVHSSEARFKVLNWGRRTGKSTFAVNECLRRAFDIPGRYFIVAPTYRQAKNIYWMDIAFTHIPKELIKKKNEAELYITLLNGSTIELKGADNPDSLRGTGIKGVVLDEYAFMRPDVWSYIIEPQLSDAKGWAIFISTPSGYNWFHDIHMFSKGYRKNEDGKWDLEFPDGRPNWFYSHATTYDNPHMPPDEIERIRKETDEDEFGQEYLAEFRKMKGLVYEEFSQPVHVVYHEANPNWQYYITADFGFTNPSAVLLVGADRDDNWYILDEVYETGLTTELLATRIKNMIGGRFITALYGDSAAAQSIADLAVFGLYLQPVKKEGSNEGSIIAGIREVARRLKVQELSGKPKLFINPKCANIIYEFEAYHWPDKQFDRNQREVPVKQDDHALDALRYLAMVVKNPTNIGMTKPARFMKQKEKHRIGRR